MTKPINLADYGYQVNVERINTIIEMICNEGNVFTMAAFSLDRGDLEDLDQIFKDDEEAQDLVKRVLAENKFDHPCSTPACLCGWINHARSIETKTKLISYGNKNQAAEWIGIPRYDKDGKIIDRRTIPAADHLFMTGNGANFVDREQITREMAIYQLEQMRDHNIMWKWEDVVQRFKELGHG